MSVSLSHLIVNPRDRPTGDGLYNSSSRGPTGNTPEIYTRHKRFITYQSHTKAQADHKRQEHLKKLPPAIKGLMTLEHEED